MSSSQCQPMASDAGDCGSDYTNGQTYYVPGYLEEPSPESSMEVDAGKCGDGSRFCEEVCCYNGDELKFCCDYQHPICDAVHGVCHSDSSFEHDMAMAVTGTPPAIKAPEPKATACPWTYGCIDKSGTCIRCDESPWYNTDGKCTCGPTADDWHAQGDCQKCNGEADVDEPEPSLAATPQCPWTYGCIDKSGTCIRCDESPWYNTDGKCTCGPTADDWHAQGDCQKCGGEADVDVMV